MTREDYLEQMQTLRKEQQENARMNRDAFDKLEDEYKQKKQELYADHEARKRALRDKRTATQHDIEQRMHELKVQWAKEHPIEEVFVVN